MYDSHWTLVGDVTRQNKKFQYQIMTHINELLSLVYMQISKRSVSDLISIIESNHMFYRAVWVRKGFRQVLFEFNTEIYIHRKAKEILLAQAADYYQHYYAQNVSPSPSTPLAKRSRLRDPMLPLPHPRPDRRQGPRHPLPLRPHHPPVLSPSPLLHQVRHQALHARYLF